MKIKHYIAIFALFIKRISLFVLPIFFVFIDYYIFHFFNLFQDLDKNLFLIALGYLCYVMIISIWKIPVWQTQKLQNECTLKEIGELQDTYRRTIAQIAGGAALLTGIYFTWSSLIISQEGQITERFTKAVEQLGNENVAIRLGGIYALERIYNESQNDREAILKILTAYVRKNARIEDSKKEIQNELKSIQKIAEDIQAVLTVLGHQKNYNNYQYNLKNSSLVGANLEFVEFKRGDFTGSNLSYSNLKNANLAEGEFINSILFQTNFSEANLKKAIFTNSDMRRVDFKMAQLQEAYFENIKAEEIQFWGANLDGAILKNVDFSKTTGLTSRQLEQTEKYGKVILPKELEK